METEKVCIVIKKVLHVDTRIVTVLTEWDEEVPFPLSQVERYGNNVFLPAWLAIRMFGYSRVYGGQVTCPAHA